MSSTGRWFDVGHYTQIVWRKTTQVGCGISQAGGNDILVCRYSPPGNFMSQPVY
ncbi:MAG: CAP domain-containing protein [Cyanobacteriota bacterium]|nr:CAP domain-containing protein [Cyanobacteriota bacterium]